MKKGVQYFFEKPLMGDKLKELKNILSQPQKESDTVKY
jgi:hypothetical protein